MNDFYITVAIINLDVFHREVVAITLNHTGVVAGPEHSPPIGGDDFSCRVNSISYHSYLFLSFYIEDGRVVVLDDILLLTRMNGLI